MASTQFIGSVHDFDFLIGRWKVMNRRLRRRHEGSSDWDEFSATSQALTLLDGGVSVDEIHFPARDSAVARCPRSIARRCAGRSTGSTAPADAMDFRRAGD